MYWIQDYGQKTGANREDFKLFHCDYKTDIDKLPTRTAEGTDAEAGDEANELAKAGDQCFCIEDGSVWELGYATNAWKKI